ncbi:RNA polymerase II transcription elongation factor-domain-containing protein [Aspergillus leporis]|uniref:RNA polymerase II transcription elongation factor-domain-containing protein n=1 Tax=Aspergillus leporis TaxID=41062 RepID=A0A5N5WGM0_9EURO|nr:RNA polymerase II transcription elongation factor-domain-containing protein [Aspergillus leporis]
MAAPAVSTGLIDPTKQAEYPIILGDRLSKNGSSQSELVNIQYNYKTKSATAQQRSIITRSSQSRDHYNLTITDKAPNAEQSVLTYTYQGSVDPDQTVSEPEERNLVLVFDSHRKVFVLEPVATQLNFNLRSAPAKTEKQVLEQYEQFKILQGDDQPSGDDRSSDHASGNDDGPADEANPYDYRHFLPKENAAEDDKSISDNTTPEPYYSTSKANTPLIPAITKPTPSPKPRPKTNTNPLRLPKPAKHSKHDSTATPKTSSKPQPQPRDENEKRKKDEENVTKESAKSPAFENGSSALLSQQPAPSPGSNIIIDGDLIIDMGSPPPSRPAFRVNPAHFSSNNTPANNDDGDEDEDIEDLRLPSPAGHGGLSAHTGRAEPISNEQAEEDEVEDDDALAAEMEAAFEESAREEEARSQQSLHHYAPSDDESEVSEEE